MKYLFVSAVICCAIGLSHQKFSKESIEEMMNKVMADCAAREGASADDIKFLLDRNLPETKPQKCLAACVGEDSEMIAGGTVNIPYLEKLMKKTFGDDHPKIPVVLDIAKVCAQITDPDRCELVSKMYACGKDEAIKRNLKLEDFM